MLNNKEVMEALLAGKVLVDSEPQFEDTYMVRFNKLTGTIEEYNSVVDLWEKTDSLSLGNWKLKPETININGYEVPRPLDKINKGGDYYLVDLNSAKLYKHGIWEDLYYLTEFLRRGLVHSTRKNCIQHAEALLSFTQEA